MMKLCYVFPSCLASLLPVQSDAGNVGVNGYMSQALRLFKIKGIPRVRTFLHALPQCGNDPGCSGKSPLPPSWGPWSGHEPWAWQTRPASTPEPWPS